jgi:hypothetical protein
VTVAEGDPVVSLKDVVELDGRREREGGGVRCYLAFIDLAALDIERRSMIEAAVEGLYPVVLLRDVSGASFLVAGLAREPEQPVEHDRAARAGMPEPESGLDDLPPLGDEF